jgi:hypothetical protein
MIGVDLDILLPLFRHVLVTKDRFDRARRLACAAIDAFIRVDIEMLNVPELSLIFARMYAINGANVNAGCILGSDTRLANHINSHYRNSPS